MIVMADSSKLVATLGRFPLPIEVNPFGLGATQRAVAAVQGRFGTEAGLRLRQAADGQPFVSDGGHYILDASFGRISSPKALSLALLDIPGVVQHGLFIDICRRAYVAGPQGVRIHES
jgi:ribose 5-phosphate isomerase A